MLLRLPSDVNPAGRQRLPAAQPATSRIYSCDQRFDRQNRPEVLKGYVRLWNIDLKLRLYSKHKGDHLDGTQADLSKIIIYRDRLTDRVLGNNLFDQANQSIS
jgi:hypothetical protein